MNEPPTERYFPATLEHKQYAYDIAARVAAGAAIVLALGLYVLGYVKNVDRVERDRSACVREQRDLRVELQAWEEVAAFGPSVEGQIDRLARVIRRDCNARYPDPGLLP